MRNLVLLIFCSVCFWTKTDQSKSKLKILLWGPGLNARITLPVRYFFIQVQDESGENNATESLGEKVFNINVNKEDGSRARVWSQVLDRNDGSYIARYRLYESCDNLVIKLLYNGENVGDSPYKLTGMSYHEKCYCPIHSINKWYQELSCEEDNQQIHDDLSPFTNINMKDVRKEAVARFSNAGQHSLCYYKIIDNKIYRKTYGQHVGFKMFTDAIFLSITSKVTLPDVEFFVNLGDWPLVQKNKKTNKKHLPIFSWCGSDDTADIIMPTYDITESTLEMMARVSLDIFSTQANTGPKWEFKEEKAFWRGRDSRQERLDLVVLGRKRPDLINASLTHMFFFPKNEAKYGPQVAPISFFDFFKFKYQVNIDGTVAAYRLPYLLSGDAVVLKQDSSYYEHFYHKLKPNEHYIPFKRDLTDLLEILEWAKIHDEEVKQIAKNAQKFVRENLSPKDIFCYHVKLFDNYSKLLKNKPELEDGFEFVPQADDHDSHCNCKRKEKVKQRDEL